MKIEAATEKAFLERYYTLLSPITEWTPREIDVAVAMALVYRKLLRKKEAQNKGTPEAERIGDVMAALKKPEVLDNLTRYLDMPFVSFRNYVSKLKAKWFFSDGTINPKFLPLNGSVNIEIVLKDKGNV